MSRISNVTTILMLIYSTMTFASHQEPLPTGTVHLRILFAGNADDLGIAEVTQFKSRETGEDYSAKFKENSATQIPYGTYYLRAHQKGFWSVERTVVVRQPHVWVVMGLTIGMEGEMTLFNLSGTIRNKPPEGEQVWVRIVSAYSNLIADAKVENSGAFSISGLPQDTCVLIVWSGSKILHTSPVIIPSKEPIVVDLAKLKD